MYYDVDLDMLYFACLTVTEIIFFAVCICCIYESIKYVRRLVRNGNK
jgi:hypothetical protein